MVMTVGEVGFSVLINVCKCLGTVCTVTGGNLPPGGTSPVAFHVRHTIARMSVAGGLRMRAMMTVTTNMAHGTNTNNPITINTHEPSSYREVCMSLGCLTRGFPVGVRRGHATGQGG